jgi:hypothetical protein
VTWRGNPREDIFEVGGDRKTFLEILGKVANRFNCLKYACFLTANHCHLVTENTASCLSALESPQPQLRRGAAV